MVTAAVGVLVAVAVLSSPASNGGGTDGIAAAKRIGMCGGASLARRR